MKKVCVVVPIYKEKLNEFERISLTQLFRMLSNYPICFVMPKTLTKPKYICENSLNIMIEKFHDYYFQSTKTYSELLMATTFYDRFKKYDYILIYQLDAFVFSDRLMEFAEMGYDYIGAPINNRHWREYHVGNGGLSLRKVSTVLTILSQKDAIIRYHHRKRYFETREDNFWAYCGIKAEIDFSVPDVYVANRFSTQSNCFHALDEIKNKELPFGTHHFPKWNYNLWENIVKSYGYNLPMASEVNYIDTSVTDCHYNEIEEFQLFLDKLFKEKIIDESLFGLSKEKKYCIWGAGEWGYQIYRICKMVGIEIIEIYDQNPLDSCIVMSSVKPPDLSNIRRMQKDDIYIQIAAEKCSNEIENELRETGLVDDKRINSFNNFKAGWDVIWNEWKSYDERK